MADLHPTAGIRILLELASSDGTGARYRASVFTPAAQRDFLVAIAAGGEVSVEGVEPGDDATHVDALRRNARAVAKDALALDPVVWPRRILRWRDK